MNDTIYIRDELFIHYRTLRQAIQSHLDAALKCVSTPAFKEAARRIGLLAQGALIVDRESEMTLAFDLAVFGQKPGRSRAIDRYAKAVHCPQGSPQEITLKALVAAKFRVVRVKGRHHTAGNVVEDIAHNEELWLLDEGLEKTLTDGEVLAARLIPIDPFHTTVGAIVPMNDQIFKDALYSLAARRGTIDKNSLDDPRMAEAIYEAAIRTGIMANMSYSDE
jgi:hypothetical protein